MSDSKERVTFDKDYHGHMRRIIEAEEADMFRDHFKAFRILAGIRPSYPSLMEARTGEELKGVGDPDETDEGYGSSGKPTDKKKRSPKKTPDMNMEADLDVIEGEFLEQGQWVQRSIKRPGRLRRYFGVGPGEKIPMDKLKAAYKKLKGKKDKTSDEISLMRCMALGVRLKGGDVPGGRRRRGLRGEEAEAVQEAKVSGPLKDRKKVAAMLKQLGYGPIDIKSILDDWEAGWGTLDLKHARDPRTPKVQKILLKYTESDSEEVHEARKTKLKLPKGEGAVLYKTVKKGDIVYSPNHAFVRKINDKWAMSSGRGRGIMSPDIPVYPEGSIGFEKRAKGIAGRDLPRLRQISVERAGEID